MRATDIITKKRDGHELTDEELWSFIDGYMTGRIPDYQAAAWLMAVYLQGMTPEETVSLTSVMIRSGQVMDLSDIAPFVVDKHSTGGVGDKTTLVVAPLVASTGLPVGKISGRGLAFTGGTVDKLESIPGFRCDLSVSEFRDRLRKHGIVISSQTKDLTPADGALYALRDVTATISSIPLIASSIMSKKIAAGANGIVLDVKVGDGAFVKTLDEAESLTKVMLEIGQSMNRKMSAVLSNMNQPLGNAVGNALEVIEAIDTLRGDGPPDLTRLCLTLAAQMLLLEGHVQNEREANALLRDSLNSKVALDKFREWVTAQGGNPDVVDAPRSVLPVAKFVEVVRSKVSGWVSSLDAMEVGLAAFALGAGRARKEQPIDPAVGIVVHRKVGDQVHAGDPLYTIHSSVAPENIQYIEAQKRVDLAYQLSCEPVPNPELILKIM